MYAVRQIQKVKDHTVVVHLPEDFPTNRVEVIILPVQLPAAEPEATETDEAPVGVHCFLTRDTSQFTLAQRQAYDRACAVIRQGSRCNVVDNPRNCPCCSGINEHGPERIG